MTQAYDAIIATITTASDATQVTKAMVKSTQWRAGTSGTWLSTDCTLNANSVYQFRTPVSGMSSLSTAILPNIKASVVVDWDATATAITTVGNYFMYYYAYNCSSLTSLSVPDTSGLTTVSTYFMAYYASGCTALTSLSVPDTSGLTTVGDYFMASYASYCALLTSLSVPDTSGLTTVATNFMASYASYCTSLTSLSVPDTSGLTTVGDYFMYNYARNCALLTSLSVPDTSGLTTVGNYFMYSYARNCTSLTSLLLPSSTGWFASNNINWSVPSGRLNYLYGYTPDSTSQTAWQTLTASGYTLYTNYIQSSDYVLVEGGGDDYTLTCAAGSYSLTGSSVTLTHTPASQNLTQAYDRIIATITTASDASQVVKAMVKSTEWRAGTSGDWNATSCTLTASNVYQFRTPLSGMDTGSTAILPNIKASVVVDWDATATAITSVGDYFMYSYAYGCTSLTSLSVPDTSGLTTVGDGFMASYAGDCTLLTSLSVPDTSGLTTVGDGFMAYYAGGCTSLTSLSVPDTSGLTTVGDGFMASYAGDCTLLTSLSVPDTSGLTTVGDEFMASYAGGCTLLTSLLLPSTTGWFTSHNVSWSVPSTRLGSLKGYAPNSTAQTAWQALTASGYTLYTNYIQSSDYVLVEGGSSGQNLTLTCAAGSYSLTGTNVTLTHTPASQNLTLACNAGSYALTGTNTALTSSRTLSIITGDIIVSGAGTTAVNGTYAEYGTREGKTRYRMASAASPTGYFYIVWYGDEWWISFRGEDGDAGIQIMAASRYSSNDNVATPDLVTTWSVSQGIVPVPTVISCTNAYTLTGTDADLVLLRNYILACEAGSYALTGTNADLTVKRNYVLACNAGSYTLTGTDATLTVQRNYTLVCESGSYTLTGTDITFGNSKAYSLTCEAGVYTLTGSSVSFAIQRNYSLACETGSYTLTGTDVTLTYTQGAQNFTLACEAGSYALTGTNAALTSARTMALESGSYALTGTNADFYRALVMACDAGSYALTGSDASLTSHRIFALGMGSYVLVGTSVGLFILSITPACRTAIIEYENRTFAIPHENRTLEVKCH